MSGKHLALCKQPLVFFLMMVLYLSATNKSIGFTKTAKMNKARKHSSIYKEQEMQPLTDETTLSSGTTVQKKKAHLATTTSLLTTITILSVLCQAQFIMKISNST